MDFVAQFRKQIGYLERSCRDYDEGNPEEAIRIAVALRVLFHQTQRSTSLMQHLGNPDPLMLSTLVPKKCGKRAPYMSAALLTFEASLSTDLSGCGIKDVIPLGLSAEQLMMLTESSTTMAARFKPRLDPKLLRPITFKAWWSEEIVVAAGGYVFTRRDLVLVAANKDGGAHVDEELPAAYEHLLSATPMKVQGSTKQRTPIMTIEQAPFEISIADLHHATLRQIAFEVLSNADLRRIVE